MTADAVAAYIAARPPAFATGLADLRARLCALLPDCTEVISYAMPGLRQPGRTGKMVIGYAAFTHHLGLYPHSGSIIPALDCRPFQTSKSGILFTPDHPPPDALLAAIIAARLAEIASKRR